MFCQFCRQNQLDRHLTVAYRMFWLPLLRILVVSTPYPPVPFSFSLLAPSHRYLRYSRWSRHRHFRPAKRLKYGGHSCMLSPNRWERLRKTACSRPGERGYEVRCFREFRRKGCEQKTLAAQLHAAERLFTGSWCDWASLRIGGTPTRRIAGLPALCVLSQTRWH